MRKRVPFAILAAFCCLLLAACGGSGSSGRSNTDTGPGDSDNDQLTHERTEHGGWIQPRADIDIGPVPECDELPKQRWSSFAPYVESLEVPERASGDEELTVTVKVSTANDCILRGVDFRKFRAENLTDVEHLTDSGKPLGTSENRRIHGDLRFERIGGVTGRDAAAILHTAIPDPEGEGPVRDTWKFRFEPAARHSSGGTLRICAGSAPTPEKGGYLFDSEPVDTRREGAIPEHWYNIFFFHDYAEFKCEKVELTDE